MKSFNNKKNGFTLVEMMVAVFVFSVVMVLSTGAIFNIVSANKTSQAIKSVMDNMSGALDSMSREIRYGTIYNCGFTDPSFSIPNSCSPSGGTSLAFVDKFGNNIIFAFQPGSVTSSAESLFRCKGSISNSNCTRLTAPEVHVTSLYFYVIGAMASEPQQPQLLITISGYAQAGTNKSYFNIETMVDQRNLMCKSNMAAMGILCT